MNFLVACKRGRFGFKVKNSFGIHVYHNEFLLRFCLGFGLFAYSMAFEDAESSFCFIY